MKKLSVVLAVLTIAIGTQAENSHRYIPKVSSEQQLINTITAPSNPWSVGVQAFVSPNPYCNTRSVSWVLPAVIYTSPKLNFYDTYGEYELFGTKNTSTDVVGEIFPISYNAKYGNSWAMQQLNNRYMSIMLGLQESFISRLGIVEISGQNDVMGISNGFMGCLEYAAPMFWGSVNNTFMLEPEVGLQYDSQNLNNYYFGVSQSESVKSGLPQYSASDSWGPYEALNFVYCANQRLNLDLEFQLNQMPNQVFDSPMVVKAKSVLSSTLIMTYTL